MVAPGGLRWLGVGVSFSTPIGAGVKRKDPDDGMFYTFKEVEAKFKDEYTPAEIKDYWENTMKTLLHLCQMRHEAYFRSLRAREKGPLPEFLPLR